MKTTRQRIIEYLQARQAASARELSRALHVTAADIRHHLGILTAEGVVVVVSQRKTGMRGRPTAVFGLADQVEQHNLDGLASALLRLLVDRFEPGEQPALQRRLARLLLGEKMLPARSSGQRLLKAIQLLNEMNYQARWEAHAAGARIIFERCPYASILPEHPEMCQLDGFLLEEMLGTPVEQAARLEQTAQGLRQCVFRVKVSSL